MIKHTMFAAAVAAACFLGGTVARADLLDNIMAAKKIRIATDLAIPPSGMMDASMKPTGSDVDTAELLAKDLGLEIEWVQTTGATRIPNLQTNKADVVISTLSVTPERAKVIDFTDPYAALESVVGGLKSIEVKDWDGLKGKTIAVSRGTTQDTALTNRAKDGGGFEVARYDDDATMVTAAVTGQADFIATSGTIVNQIGVKNPARPFEPKVLITTFNLAMGVKKGEPHLVAKLNEWIATNIANGKLNAIYKKYHGTDLPENMRGAS
ncbi:transporter substrate-binding domain-containing protein [Ancylobacter dichloromethanicus]|uniref:ABC transporter substrate-binding protein n=1 Tax=Ancylobacter dichloromethanicus TaxID=518825 RepID=A0A9W6N1W9_9HYPH|nr:transporter substrate-binding domain-containing protein [Ancylobacter dichloromethanicus]MBS7553103.1 transporter substrate-binding domain-containing protein [Ancylobacter dichloromethanicus]GLK74620.1 ABC transporter substrate-binding protein [Ancylobacter dichloromethanicus]